MLASRRIASCDKLAAEIEQMHGRTIRTAQVDADDVAATDAPARTTTSPRW